jgi:hypothetical protein
MCCEATETLDLPPEVIEMLAHYRRLRDTRGWDWGDDRVDMFRWARFSRLGDVFAAFADTGDWEAAVRRVVGDDPPAGIVVVRVDERGDLHADVGPPCTGIAGHTRPIDVVVDSAAPTEVTVTVAGRPVVVAAGGAAVQTIDLDGGDPVIPVALGDRTLAVEGVARTMPTAELRLSSPRCTRWSVTDAGGGAWFPADVLTKWDVNHQPFFHGHDITLAVPAGDLDIVCARGLEFDRVELTVHAAAGETTVVECDPPRLFDPTVEGWYGGDLHIHQNYSGDLVCSPADAARMQLGEGLHLANLVAGNLQTSLVYDRELFEQFPGTELPWSTEDAVATMGVEFRNDLLGHVHALGPTGPPTRYFTGHERTDHPEDWPPNKVACEELQVLDASVGYPHPTFTDFADGSTDRFFENPRSVEARELVADAALGVVDSIDLISPFDNEGAVYLYHRLLSCGLRLAATAGTDVFLSFAHGPDVASNPPGWGRVYAQLGDEALSVAAFKDAIRSGRTVVTNGPWLRLDVDGHGPGAVIDASTGDRLTVTATVEGLGAEHVAVVGPDGPIAEGDAGSPLRAEVGIDRPTWIAAVARGPAHPNTLDESVLAHTSPVYVDLDGRRVGRPADARWCLEFLDTFERFAREHGQFSPDTRDAHLGDLVSVVEEARAFYRAVAARTDG